jgi:peptide/nickel transport system substrate-binding protein
MWQSSAARPIIIGILSCTLLVGGCGQLMPSQTPAISATLTKPPAAATPTLEPEPQETPAPGHTGTLRIGWLESLGDLLLFAERPSKTDIVFSLLYDHLMYDALDNTYASGFATDWASPDGGMTWTFQLEPDVLAHDGQPLTADDVAFTLQLYQEHPKFSYFGGQTPVMERIEAVGRNTVTITLSRPVGNIEALFHWVPLLPKRMWEAQEIAETTEITDAKAVGSGPFMWSERGDEERTTLVANKGYWMGAPKVDAVSLQTYPNAEALVLAIKNGDVDLITEVPLQWIPDLKTDPHIQVVSGPQIRVRCLLFNIADKPQSTGHPALKDAKVRQAIAHAIDKQQLIDLVLLGQGMPGISIVPPALRGWFNPGIEDVAFDLEAARDLLERAGYKDADGDGVREMPRSGAALDFRLFVAADSTTGAREAEMVGNWLRQIGIKATTQALDPDALEAACCPAFDYDVILWGQDGGPDPAFFLSSLTTAQIDTGRNKTGYSNPTYDTLYEQQAIAFDKEQRLQLVWQMQEIAFDDCPCIVLYYDLAVQAFRKDRFQNWLFVPSGVLSLPDERSLLQVQPIQ